MSDKIINFEEERLKKKLENYKEDLHTNYIILKRENKQNLEKNIAIEMDQYDLYHLYTHQLYMGVSIFLELGLVNINYTNSEVQCALEFDPSIPIRKFETISIEEIEQMITYIQFTETELYANDLELAPELSLIKESSFYEEYLHVLVAIKYCLSSIAESNI